MTARVRRFASLVGAVLVGLALIGVLTVVVVRFTSLQEHSARFMGLAGMTTTVAIICAAVALVGASLVLWAGSYRWIAIGALVPCLLAVQTSAPTLFGLAAPERASAGSEFSVLVQNLSYRNQDLFAAARATLARDADVMVLLEYTPEAADAFRFVGSDRRYPYRWEVARPLGSGVAVLSRLPFGEPVDLGLSGPGARLDLQVGSDLVALFAVHVKSPRSVWSVPRWRTDMAVLADLAGGAGPATVVAGDLNSTSGHLRFRRLLQIGELRDAQDVGGGGFADTWPVGTWIPRLLRLDHILVGPGIGVHDFRMLAGVGSDHLGIEADLRVRVL